MSEVKEEKRYRVKMKGIYKLSCYLTYHIGTYEWMFDSYRNTAYVRSHHTRQQLEQAGYGEVFDSPLFEVEEVKK